MNPARSDRCAGRGDDRPLPASFLDVAAVRGGTVRRSKMGRRRALVLLGVHLVIFAHVLIWKLSGEGETLTPVEPSEAMYTVATGVINAGAIMLLVSILSTLVLGRFFCGWACHLVALQDGCAWLMKKIGVHPRPLRSRTLAFVPLAAGLFMFGMPLFVRLWHGLGLPELGLGLTRAEFWDTFPGFWLALITFLVCGFAMIWLLGSKGFCFYACPYGGLFGVADRLAPGRIRVDDRCKACGHCTAVCTSNVAVADEVHRFGMVVDPGCMKCMDCVSVCPENALSFGFGRPALGARPRRGTPRPRAASFSRGEEIALVAVFFAALFVLTGLPEAFFPWAGSLYGVMPLLFSIGLAVTAAVVAVFGARLARRDEVRLQKWALKSAGRLTRPGAVFLGIAGVFALFMLHAAVYQAAMFRGDHAFLGIDVGSLALSDRSPDADERRRLDTARGAFELAERLRVFEDLRPTSRLAGLALAEHRTADALSWFERALAVDDAYAGTWVDYATALALAGRPVEARRALERAVALAPSDPLYRKRAAEAAVQGDDLAAAETHLAALLAGHPGDVPARLALADLLTASGRPEAAGEVLEEGARRAPESAPLAKALGAYHAARGDQTLALPHLARAATLDPLDVRIRRLHEAALAATGRPEDARAEAEATRRDVLAAAAARPDDLDLRYLAANELSRAGDFGRALELLASILAVRPDDERARALADLIRRRLGASDAAPGAAPRDG